MGGTVDGGAPLRLARCAGGLRATLGHGAGDPPGGASTTRPTTLHRAILPPAHPTNVASYRPPTVADGGAIWDLARRSGTLDLNSPYAYLLLSHHFAATSVVATIDDVVVGFVVGYRPPPAPDVVFVWQVAVDDDHRGAGLASGLLDQLVGRVTTDGVRHLEATVTPSNDPSAQLFTSLAHRHGTELTITALFSSADFPGDGHEDEHLFRIGPFPAN